MLKLTPMPKKNPQPDQSRAVAYLRVSTDQTRQELGTEAQKRAIQAYAKAQNLTILAWEMDETSGGAPLQDRPGLVRALAEVRNHQAGTLLVAKRDRFTRDSLETAAVELDLRRLGARLMAADGLGNGEDAASRLMAGVLGAVAEFERQTIRTRIKAALGVKKSRGERLGTVPFGYQVAKDGVHLEPNPQEQTILQRAKELRARGLKLREVQAELCALGMVNRAGKPFALPALHKLTA